MVLLWVRLSGRVWKGCPSDGCKAPTLVALWSQHWNSWTRCLPLSSWQRTAINVPSHPLSPALSLVSPRCSNCSWSFWKNPSLLLLLLLPNPLQVRSPGIQCHLDGRLAGWLSTLRVSSLILSAGERDFPAKNRKSLVQSSEFSV